MVRISRSKEYSQVDDTRGQIGVHFKAGTPMERILELVHAQKKCSVSMIQGLEVVVLTPKDHEQEFVELFHSFPETERAFIPFDS